MDTNIIERISLYYSQLTKGERKLIKTIISDPTKLINLDIRNAARYYNTSTAALVRLAKHLEYSGFTELALMLKIYIENKDSNKENLDKLNTLFTQTILKIFNQNIFDKLKLLISKLDKAHRIISIGMGSSASTANFFKYKMNNEGYIVSEYNDLISIHDLNKSLKSNDLIVIFSVTGDKSCYRDLYKISKYKGNEICLFTMNKKILLKTKEDLKFTLPTLHIISNGIQVIDTRFIFFILICILQYLIEQQK